MTLSDKPRLRVIVVEYKDPLHIRLRRVLNKIIKLIKEL